MLNTNYVMLCTYVKTIQKPENTGENAFILHLYSVFHYMFSFHYYSCKNNLSETFWKIEKCTILKTSTYKSICYAYRLADLL